MSDYILIDHSGEVKQKIDANIEKALTAAGLQLEANGKLELENTPRRIDTGRLRNSIDHQYVPGEKAVYAGTNVEYALHVHEGTRKMTPNRFMKNALYNHVGEYKQIIEQYLKE